MKFIEHSAIKEKKGDLGTIAFSVNFLPLRNSRKKLTKISNSGMNFKKEPLITVITVVYNGERFLEKTILSVIDQSYQNFEYIVIDGGSTDQTLNIIQQYAGKIDYWVSESDSGISDAMNKGVVKAKGDYLVFIHADDYLLDKHSLAKASQYFDDQHDVFACAILYGKAFKANLPRGLNLWTYFKTGIYHQGVFCKRKVFEKVGLFDSEFNISMDYDFFLRVYKAGIKAKTCPMFLTVMRETGISSQRQNWADVIKILGEEKRIHSKHCSSSLMKYIYQLYWFLYLPYKKFQFFIKS